jgi:hypothetical protein
VSSLEEDWDAAPSAPGNIDLANRPVVKNGDGTISTVRSMSFNDNGKEVLIPTVAADGSGILSDDDAIAQYRATGKHLGMFDSPAAATAYAQRLHEDQAELYGRGGEGDSLEAAWDATPDPKAQKQQDVATLFAASVRGGEPGKLAEVFPISEKLGLPADTVERNLPFLKQEQEIQSFAAPEWMRENPAWAGIILDRPDAAPLIMRDERVSVLGKALRALTTPFDPALERMNRGEITPEQYQEEAKKPLTLEQFWPEPKQVAYRTSPLADAEGLDRLGILGRVWDQSRAGAQMNSAYASYIAAKASGKDPSGYLQEAERLEKDLVPEWYGDLNPLERISIDVVQALGSQVESLKGMGVGGAAGAVVGAAAAVASKGKALPAIGRGLLIGSKLGTAAKSFEQELGSGFGEYRKATLPDGTPVTEEAAIGMGVVKGALNAAIETLSIGPLAEGYKPLKDALAKKGGQAFLKEMLSDGVIRRMVTEIGKSWLKGGVTEGGEEFAQSLVGSTFKHLAERISAGQYGKDAAGIPWLPTKEEGLQAFDEGVSGTIGGLGVGGAMLTPSLAAVGLQARARDQAAAGVNKLALINDAAKTSPTAKGMPQLVARMITEETAQSGEALTHVHIDPKPFITLFQSNNADPNAAAIDLLGEDGAVELAAALHQGQKLSVPIGDYLSKWAGKPVAEALLEHTTTRAWHQTTAEKRAQEQANQADAERIADEHDAAEEERAKGDDVANKAQVDLQNLGFSGKEASLSVQPLRDFVRVQIEQNFPGADPDELINAAISVQSEEQFAAAAEFDFGENATQEEGGEEESAGGDVLLEEAQEAIARMTPERQELARQWLSYTQGELEKRPAVPRDLELKLAEFGVVDPAGFKYGVGAREKKKTAKQMARKKGGGGQEPSELKKARISRNMSAAEFQSLPYHMFKQGPVKGKAPAVDLLVHHNLTAEKLLHADELGGLAAPSIAISSSKHPLSNFGDISLIADPALVDPKEGVPVFESDIFSPRHPKVEFSTHTKAVIALAEELKPFERATGGYLSDLDGELEREGPKGAAVSYSLRGPLALQFLTEKGQAPEKPYGVEKNNLIARDFGRAVVAKVTELGFEEEFEKWAEAKLTKAIKGRHIRKGHTRTGKRRLIPYTLENVLKEITRPNVRGGEGGFVSLGMIRASGAKKFKSIEDIQAAREKIVSAEDFAKHKEQLGELFDRHVSALSHYTKNTEDLNDRVGRAFAESLRGRGRSLLGELAKEQFFGVPPTVLKDAGEFLGMLLATPTEYFEAKPQRVVTLGEFKAAVVPHNTPPAAIDVLKKHGLEVLTYDRNSDESRQQAIAKAAQSRQVLFQDDDINPRGYVAMGQEGARRLYDIVLGQKADLSTFLHESGHVFLEMLGDLAARPDAPQRLKDDWAKTLEYLGVKDRSEIQREHHEKWARSFEAYLYEGKAPSSSLTRAFTRFRLWLKSVYRSLQALDVELSDDIRGVFDRMFATDAEIARAVAKTPPLFRTPAEAAKAGIPIEEYPAYLKAQERAVSNATRRVELRMLKDQLQETKSWWKDEEASLREEALAEFDARNDAKADRYIRKGELPLEDGTTATEPQMGRLERTKVYELIGQERAKPIGHRLLKDTGEDPDDVAKLFGYTGGKALLDAVLNLPDRKAWAAETAQQRMLERHPDVAQDQQLLDAEVQKGLHGDHTAEWFFDELRALRSAQGEPTPPKESIRLAARIIVDRTPVGRLHEGRALQAERSAASKAAVEAAKGDYRKAAVFKHQQLLNHYIWREIQDAKAERDRFEKLAERQDGKEARGQLGLAGEELLGATDQILTAVGLSSPKPGEAAPAAGVFDEAVERLGREKMAPGFDVQLLRELIFKPRPWQQLRVDELREVAAALQQFKHLAVSARNVRLLAREIRIEDLIQGIETESSKRPKTKPRPMDDTRVGSKQRLGDWSQKAYAGMRDPEDIISLLGKTAHDFFFKGYLEARSAEDNLSMKVLAFFDKHWGDLPAEMQRRRYDVVDAGNLQVPEGLHVGGQVSRQWMWMVALNMGNESNKERLLGGYRWQERDVLSFLNKTMTAEEWRFVQDVWTLMDDVLWPEVAKAHQAINGIPPKKILATPIVTPHGTFRGGYFPAKYRGDVTRIGATQDAAAIEQLYSGPGTAASVSKGFTKERVKGFKEVVDLNWGVVPGHVAQVIHYATHDAFVRDAARVLYSSDMRRVVTERLGKGYYDQLDGFIKSVANGAAGAAADVSWIYEGMNFFKQRFVLSAIGFSLKAAAGGLANPFVAMGSGELSAFYGTTSYMGFIYRYKSMRKEALERSRELRNRTTHYSQKLRRELSEKGASGQRGRWAEAMHQMREFGGVFEEAVDQITSTVIWEGGYRQALGKGMDEKAAVTHADALVRRNFVSKNISEQPSILRDRQTVGAVMTFFSYFSKLSQVHFRIIDRFNESRFEGKAAAGSVRAAAQFLAVSVAAFGLSEALSGNGPEKDEDLAEWMRRRMLTSPWSMVPIFGEFAAKSGAAIEDQISGKKRGYRPNPRVAPAAAGAQRLYDQGAKVFNAKKSDGERAIAAFDVMLTALGIPGAGALGRAANYLRAVDEGKASTDARLQLGDESVTIPGGAVPSGLIYGPPPK